nr:BMP family ABC transporter substrate-binding protein [Spirochaetaceae bacterium]
AQEYPVMNKIIYPSFVEGAKAFDSEVTVDFRLVGNWYDAAKGNELTRALFNDGVDVILPIAGGASQGVIAAAKDLGFYISWFDNDGYTKAPGNVISSAMIMQEKMAEKIIGDYIQDNITFGKASFAGMEDGYVGFTAHEPFTDNADRAKAIDTIYNSILEKVLVLESPVL